MLYRCEICGAVMDNRPCRRVRNRMPDGFLETGVDERCPYCESGPVLEIDLFSARETYFDELGVGEI